MDEELKDLLARTERLEAASIAQAALLAAVIAHHPCRQAVQDSLEKMLDAAQTRLLFSGKPDTFGQQLAQHAHQVLQIAERHAAGNPPA